jgi:hypothetical protein
VNSPSYFVRFGKIIPLVTSTIRIYTLGLDASIKLSTALILISFAS